MFNGRLSPKVLVNGLLVLLIVAILLGRKFACLPGMNMDQGDIGQWAEREITVGVGSYGCSGLCKGQGWDISVPENKKLSMEIPTSLIPKCPVDGSDVVMNLRSDDSFLEDDGWQRAALAYNKFIEDLPCQWLLHGEICSCFCLFRIEAYYGTNSIGKKLKFKFKFDKMQKRKSERRKFIYAAKDKDNCHPAGNNCGGDNRSIWAEQWMAWRE